LAKGKRAPVVWLKAKELLDKRAPKELWSKRAPKELHLHPEAK